MIYPYSANSTTGRAVAPAVALFVAAALLAACQGPGDGPAEASDAGAKYSAYGSDQSVYCNGPCDGFQRRRGSLGPH